MVLCCRWMGLGSPAEAVNRPVRLPRSRSTISLDARHVDPGIKTGTGCMQTTTLWMRSMRYRSCLVSGWTAIALNRTLYEMVTLLGSRLPGPGPLPGKLGGRRKWLSCTSGLLHGWRQDCEGSSDGRLNANENRCVVLGCRVGSGAGPGPDVSKGCLSWRNLWATQGPPLRRSSSGSQRTVLDVPV